MAVGDERWRQIVLRRVLLLTIVLVLALPWLGRVFTHVPVDDASDDAWFILWVLDWVHHALATAPGTLFDPPVNYPAPKQLAGSEHFLSSQLLFAPLRWLTESSVAAANLTAILSYILAVVCMDVLLIALGVEPWAAFVVSLAYTFGWQGRPGRLHILQSQHFYLPLAALALHRLREFPTRRRALVLTAILTAGFLSSYHMAVYLGVGMAVWGAAESLRPGDGRVRYAGRAMAAAVVATAVLAMVSMPYLLRPEAHGHAEVAYSRWETGHLEPAEEDFASADPLFVLRSFVGCAVGGGQSQSCLPIDWLAERIWTLGKGGVLPLFAVVVPVLVLIGLADAAQTASSRRRIFLVGAAFVLTAVLIVGPAYCVIAGVEFPLPPVLLAASPARFIRVPDRALVIAFFGGSLLVACGLDLGFRRLGRVARTTVVLLLALAIPFRFPWSPAIRASKTMPRTFSDGLGQFGRLSPDHYLVNPALGADAPNYEALAEKVRVLGQGPLLDLPATSDGTAVVGQMIHRQPSISFYTGYLPAHVSIVDHLISELPRAEVLNDLIDITELRWIVLRPQRQWPSADEYHRYANTLSEHPRVVTTMSVGDFTLVQLDATSHHPEWPRSIAAGPVPGFSALGTPLVPLPATGGQASVQVDASSRARAGWPVDVRVAVANESSRAWAASPPARPGMPFTVRLELRWTQAGDTHDQPAPETFELRRDVQAGEKIEQVVRTTAPDRPGRYYMKVAVRQVDGADLSSPRNPASAEVEIAP